MMRSVWVSMAVPSKSVPFRFGLHLAAGHVKYNIVKVFRLRFGKRTQSPGQSETASLLRRR
jgi:hypothetical protein